MTVILAQFLTGLANAASLFLVAVGLSLIFGVTRIVNFAHGSLYMLGAYLAWTLVHYLDGGALGFWLGVLLAALGVGLFGLIIELLVLRRIYHAPELFQLLATFGIVLVVQDLVLWLWGPQDRIGPQVPGLDGAVGFAGTKLPAYDLVLIALSPLTLLGLWLLFRRTRWGLLVRAATQDREMLAALGVNQAWLFTAVFFLGAALAGLGGAVQLPKGGAHTLLDVNIIATAFVIVVVGGMGSIVGALLASIVIGELNAFGVLFFPELTLVLMFLAMAVILVLRPQGLLGRATTVPARTDSGYAPLRPPGWSGQLGWALVLAALIALPWISQGYTLVLAIELLIAALFAASLHFMMGPGGMISFGHAAYFGLGAYGAATLVAHLDAAMIPALLVAPLVGGLGALVVGGFCVRLSGVYLAMLTLACAQITWSAATQWYALTGGDDGLLGIWPASWASDRTHYYYLTLALCGLGILALRHLIFTPFGYALRAGRDSPARAEAVGIPVRLRQWQAFTVAGLCAGLAGGLYVFSKGSVFPDVLAIPRSVDALVMVLLGGVQTLSGPLFGATAY
ncbi:MAG: ABC transporter permease, partial [Candidatus Competibacterales bacterium]|nr:ABC transporter permease [Candidatus Competibacterales bacterium]